MSGTETQSPEKKMNTSPTARAKTESWYVFRDERHFGPFSTDSVVIFLKRGFLAKKHYIWKSGWDAWQEISKVSEFDLSIQEEALNITDEQFIQMASLKREDLVGFRQKHQAAAEQDNSVQKSKFMGVTDLYDSIKQKLNFRIKENLSETEE